LTIEELEDRLDQTTLKSGGMLFGRRWVEVDAAEVKAALSEIRNKLPRVEAGLDRYAACEILMFRLIVSHCECAASAPQSDDAEKGKN
jgi:hypothetical protein